MELEHRIEVLEQEVQLLKSQIQATLLDIQEHLLTNAYPALRAEDTSSANAGAAPSTSARPQPKAETSNNSYESPVVRRVSFNEPPAPEPSNNGRDLPLVKKVSLQTAEPDLQDDEEPEQPISVSKITPDAQKKSKSANGSRPNLKPVEPDPDPEPEQSLNESLKGELEKWTLNRIEKYGVSRTRDLIDTYLDEGRMDEATRDTLYALISRHEEAAPSAPRQKSRDVKPASNGFREQQEAPLRIVPETRVTLKARRNDDGTQYEDVRATLDETTARGLVTRLISGVRNAGGTKRKNKNG